MFDVTDQVKDTVTVDVGQSEINNGTGGIGTTIEIEVPAVEVCPSERFVDIYENEWYHEAVDYVFKNGLMIGMDETHFEPNDPATREANGHVLCTVRQIERDRYLVSGAICPTLPMPTR